MTTYPASAKQINWIKDMLEKKDWANSKQPKYVSRAAVINLMISWANEIDTDSAKVPDKIRAVMAMYNQVGDRINAGMQYMRSVEGARNEMYLYEDVDTKSASKLIEWLKPMAEKAAKSEADALIDELTEAPAAVELEDGMYKNNDGQYIKVYKTQKGHQVAKIARIEQVRSYDRTKNEEIALDGQWTVEFEYAGKAPLKSLRPSMKLTIEQAREFGMIYGSCICCNRTLTDELSVYLGIGPVCGKREFGEPFKQMLKSAKLDLDAKAKNA